MHGIPVLTASCLAEFGKGILVAVGTPVTAARAVATSLVESDLRGHDSHGIVRTLAYMDKIRAGQLVPDAEPEIAKQSGAVATVDGRWSFGQLSAQLGAEHAGDMAEQSGIGLVALSRTNHVGRLGEYVEAIAERGLVGIAISGGAARGGAVAPFGGRERIFGTNPLAWAVPTGPSQRPLVADFATAATAEGKIAVAHASGEQIHDGLVIDRNGLPTTDPADFYAGGALLPFGGHKGYGILLLIELLANVLAESAPVSSEHYQQGNPTLVIAIAVDSFVPQSGFETLADELVARVRSSQPAPNHAEVLLPGDLERRTLAARSHDGIPVGDEIWRRLTKAAEEVGAPGMQALEHAGRLGREL